MIRAYILALALHIAPYTRRQAVVSRATSVIEAVEAAGGTPSDAVALLVIDLFETTLGARGVPFGTCAAFCSHRCGGCRAVSDREAANVAIRVWLESQRQCGRSLARRFGYYHSGTCRRDAFADREAAFHRRFTRDYDRHSGAWR